MEPAGQVRSDLAIDDIPWPALLFGAEGRLVSANNLAQRLFPGLGDGTQSLPDCLLGALARELEACDSGDADSDWPQTLAAWLTQPRAPTLVLDLPAQKRYAFSRLSSRDGGLVLLLDDRSELRQMGEALRLSARALEVRTREHRLAMERARASAERAQRSKMRFFAAASHDLLQPLNAARIFASALADQHSAHPEIRELSERIDASLDVAEEVIDVLVDIAKLQSHGFKASIEEFPIREVLDSLATQYRSIADRRDLRLALGPGDWTVRSDRRLLRRLLQNLLANALRYTARGGVLIGARKRGRRLSIEVWDTGIGIPAERLQEVFEEFQRGHADSPWGEKGLGLGLSICSGIATLLGHPLRVASMLGKGSKFAVEVDLANTSKPSAAVVERVPPVGRAQIAGGLRVLCVDNERGILEALSLLLRGWGVNSTAAVSVAEALEHCSREMPDLILADYQLDSADGLDGLDLHRLIAEAYPEDRRPSFALLTANRFDGLKQKCEDLGVHVLHKPVKANRLRALLESQPKARFS